jgi:hypothetical protein
MKGSPIFSEAVHKSYLDTVVECDGVGPTPPRGRDNEV